MLLGSSASARSGRGRRDGFDEELTHGGKPLSDAAISASDEGDDRRAKSLYKNIWDGYHYERDVGDDRPNQTGARGAPTANEQLARDRGALDASFGDLAQSLSFRANKPDRNDDDDDYDRDCGPWPRGRVATDPSIAPAERRGAPRRSQEGGAALFKN